MWDFHLLEVAYVLAYLQVQYGVLLPDSLANKFTCSFCRMFLVHKGFSATFSFPQRLKCNCSLQQSKIFLDMWVWYSYRLFRSHKCLTHSFLCQVPSTHFPYPCSTVTRNPQQLVSRGIMNFLPSFRLCTTAPAKSNFMVFSL